MGIVAGGTVHRPRPPHLPPPFGLVSPRSPRWPPSHYKLFTIPGQKGPSGPWSWLLKGINWITGFLPSQESDLSALANAVDDKLRKLALLAEQDIHDAFTTNLDYSHAILQHANDIGRAAERDILGLARDIHALTHRIEHERLARIRADHAYYRKAEHNIAKARSYAIAKSAADTRAYIAKHVYPEIHALKAWVNHADTWLAKRIAKWWAKTYIKQIRPIKTQNNNQSIQIGIIWATINGEIRPTVKLAAGAKDWLKWFAHWKKLAVEAFAALKATEVLAWLAETYEHDRNQPGITNELTAGEPSGTNVTG